MYIAIGVTIAVVVVVVVIVVVVVVVVKKPSKTVSSNSKDHKAKQGNSKDKSKKSKDGANVEMNVEMAAHSPAAVHSAPSSRVPRNKNKKAPRTSKPGPRSVVPVSMTEGTTEEV